MAHNSNNRKRQRHDGNSGRNGGYEGGFRPFDNNNGGGFRGGRTSSFAGSHRRPEIWDDGSDYGRGPNSWVPPQQTEDPVDAEIRELNAQLVKKKDAVRQKQAKIRQLLTVASENDANFSIKDFEAAIHHEIPRDCLPQRAKTEKAAFVAERRQPCAEYWLNNGCERHDRCPLGFTHKKQYIAPLFETQEFKDAAATFGKIPEQVYKLWQEEQAREVPEELLKELEALEKLHLQKGSK